MTARRPTRLAIIGCGAVVQHHILPALRRIGWRPCVLADPSQRNIDASKRIIGASKALKTVSDWTTAADDFDAAIVAAPHVLHGPIGLALAESGKHVFMEKPLAIQAAEGMAAIAAAEKAGTIFSVGLLRRYLHISRWTEALVRSGLLGRIRSFEIREGFVFNWATSTDGLLRPSVAGGGVLMDTGAHTIDQLTWWLGDVAKIEYRDDGSTGVEAECEIDCEMVSGAKGRISLSRSRNLPNTCRIEGTHGYVEVHLSCNEVIACSANVQGFTFEGLRPDALPEQRFPELFSSELKDFHAGVADGIQRGVPAAEGQRTVAFIQRCYEQRQRLEMPWIAGAASNNHAPTLPVGSRATITGATGFIGGRLAERLLERGVKVRCLVRNFGSAVRLARLPVEIRRIDLADATAVTAAVEDSDFVFHCAYDPRSRPQNISAATNLIAASLSHGVKRLVHTSTFSVYEPFADGLLTEDTPDGDRKWAYTRIKLGLEQMILEATRTKGLQGTVLQPSIVYGPFSQPWTIGPAEKLLRGTVVLPNGGDGLCNALYVDDLVDAMILAATRPEAIGERFIISGPETVPWGTFFEAIAGAIGKSPPQYRPADQIARENSGVVHDVKLVLNNPKKIVQIAVRSPAVRNLLQTGLDSMPKPLYDLVTGLYFSSGKPPTNLVQLPDPQLLRLYSAKASVLPEKAQRLLGYVPRFDFGTGMRLTGLYLQWAYGHASHPAVADQDQQTALVPPTQSLADAV